MGNTSAKHLDKEDIRQLKEQTECIYNAHQITLNVYYS